MRTSLAVAIAALLASAGCKKDEPSPATTSPAASASSMAGSRASGASASAAVVAESLPRCRADGARVAIPGDEVVTGDAAVASDALLVGVVATSASRAWCERRSISPP
jgi:hypothetical protein